MLARIGKVNQCIYTYPLKRRPPSTSSLLLCPRPFYSSPTFRSQHFSDEDLDFSPPPPVSSSKNINKKYLTRPLEQPQKAPKKQPKRSTTPKPPPSPSPSPSLKPTGEQLQRYRELCEELERYRLVYYHAQQSELESGSLPPDQQYDLLFNELLLFEQTFPQLISPSSPSQTVAPSKPPAPAADINDGKILHSFPMLGLSNAYNDDDLLQFHSRVQKFLLENPSLIPSPPLPSPSDHSSPSLSDLPSSDLPSSDPSSAASSSSSPPSLTDEVGVRVGDGVEGSPTKRSKKKAEKVKEKAKEKEKVKGKEKEGEIGLEYVTEIKYDGMAVSLVFDDGLFQHALSRGDGKYGEVITNTFLFYVSNLPFSPSKELRIEERRGRVVIRGEVVVPLKEISRVNEVKRELKKKEFSHPRNLVAGCLNKDKLNGSERAGEGEEPELHLVCYGLYSCPPPGTEEEGEEGPAQFPDRHSERMELLRRWGFSTCSRSSLFTSFPLQVLPYIRSVQHAIEQKEGWEYEADGIVIKINSESIQRRIGRIARSPKWAVAYKFWNNTAQTKLLEICFQIGRTGKAIPVGQLAPVTISGAVITKGTLHNVKFIEDNQIFPDRDVIVERSGGAGVKISRLAFPSLYSSLPPPSHPPSYHCPCDKKHPLVPREGDKYNLYCPEERCRERFCTLLEHFAAALNVKGLGIGMLRDLIYYDIISSAAHLLTIAQSRDQLKALPGWGDIKIEKLIKSIDLAKKAASPSDTLFALSIPQCGKGMCDIITSKLPSLWVLSTLSASDLIALGIPDVCSSNLSSFFSDLHLGKQPFIAPSLSALHSAGLNLGGPPPSL